jgi:hypothetical protein
MASVRCSRGGSVLFASSCVTGLIGADPARAAPAARRGRVRLHTLLILADGNLCRNTFDHRLRCIGIIGRQLILALLIRMARLPFRAIIAITPIAALLARLTLGTFSPIGTLFLAAIVTIIGRIAIIIILVLGITGLGLVVVTLQPLLHLRLGGHDNAVVVFGMLKVILSHDPVAGTLRITGKVHVLFRYMLRCSSNFHIGTGAVISARKRVLTFAIAAIAAAIVVSAASATALVLLSWPHSIVTWLCS